jgi:hypothetical protein
VSESKFVDKVEYIYVVREPVVVKFLDASARGELECSGQSADVRVLFENGDFASGSAEIEGR